MNRRFAIAASVILVVVVVAFFAIRWRDRRSQHVAISTATDSAFSEVAVGQPEAKVIALLGNPSGLMSHRVLNDMFDRTECVSRAAQVLYFYRAERPSFFVFLDDHSVVVCKESRVIAIHTD